MTSPHEKKNSFVLHILKLSLILMVGTENYYLFEKSTEVQ